MLIFRPIKSTDLDGLMNLLKNSGHGLTSLPKDEKILAQKILHSTTSFESSELREKPAGESYLFVVEDLFDGKLVGVSGIISKIGGFDAYYFYRLKTRVMKSRMLKVEKEVRTLHMEKTHAGPAEICSLFLDPEFRSSQNGRFLSLSRFLYMAENQKDFESEVIAEMRGQVDDSGHSPFWEAVGHKFMDIDFVQADYLSLKSKTFIEELLPDVPILVDLLPKEAQDVVAEVHPNTKPARHILEQEGFLFNGLVGIFEPGPVLEAKLKDVRAFKESRVITVKEIDENPIDSETFIISTSEKPKFRSCLGKIEFVTEDEARISAVTATALKLRRGDKLRYVTFKP
ncbi:MAG: arginine N-succinyltransferase [Bdellovibrionota bacterium]|nr:arginine N-succinyltransferase [Bdellovibrionota bacterium]